MWPGSSRRVSKLFGMILWSAILRGRSTRVIDASLIVSIVLIGVNGVCALLRPLRTCTIAHPRRRGHGGAEFPGFDRPLCSIEFVRQFALAVSISGLDKARSSPNCLMLSMSRGSTGTGADMRAGEWGRSSWLQHYCVYLLCLLLAL